MGNSKSLIYTYRCQLLCVRFLYRSYLVNVVFPESKTFEDSSHNTSVLQLAYSPYIGCDTTHRFAGYGFDALGLAFCTSPSWLSATPAFFFFAVAILVSGRPHLVF